MYYIRPAQPFQGFDEFFGHTLSSNQIMTALLRYCGFKTLHQECWLYKFLQERIRQVKFAGTSEFRRWCTWPGELGFHVKMPAQQMRLNRAQFERWKDWLQEHEDEIRANCSGPQWQSYYDPR